MNVFSVNDAWLPPGGVFDFELLSEPGTFDNVINGFVFFVGAGVRELLEWLPDSTILRTVGDVPREGARWLMLIRACEQATGAVR